jgi:ketosteroid isomerase-like protein
MTNPDSDLLERFYAVQRRLYAGEAVAEELQEMLTDDVVWHVPGSSAIAGTYRGREQVVAYFETRREIADNTFRITPREVLANSHRVVHFADGEATINGHTRRWRTVGVFTVRDARIAECRLLPFDQYEFDEIWARRDRSTGPAAPSDQTGRNTADAVPAVVWQRDVPQAIRSLDTMLSPDYADIFTATTSETPDMSAEQWARAALQAMPLLLRLLTAFAQRLLLGLRLQWRRSPEQLLGWKITDRGGNWFRIEAASWFMTAHCVLHVDERHASLATFVRYDRRIAALIWPPVSIVHRRVGLALMRRGATVH